MPQFIIPAGKSVGEQVTLSLEESRHVSKVLRAKVGERLHLTDGAGKRFLGRILSLSARAVSVRLDEILRATELSGHVVLAQGLLKGEKMELVIQKAAELGADEVCPFTSSRSIATWKTERRKLARWDKIAQAASKQSGRANHLNVREPVAFAKILKEKADDKLLFWEEGGPSAREFLLGRRPQRVVILIGPEGGLSQEEVDRAFDEGFAVLSLGPLILRAETAAITALSIVQYELGNI